MLVIAIHDRRSFLMNIEEMVANYNLQTWKVLQIPVKYFQPFTFGMNVPCFAEIFQGQFFGKNINFWFFKTLSHGVNDVQATSMTYMATKPGFGILWYIVLKFELLQ